MKSNAVSNWLVLRNVLHVFWIRHYKPTAQPRQSKSMSSLSCNKPTTDCTDNTDGEKNRRTSSIRVIRAIRGPSCLATSDTSGKKVQFAHFALEREVFGNNLMVRASHSHRNCGIGPSEVFADVRLGRSFVELFVEKGGYSCRSCSQCCSVSVWSEP